MLEDYCQLQFISEPARVRNMVHCLLHFIDSYNPVPEVRDDLKLIFSELLYNAVIHGNKGDCNKCVNVRIEATGDCLRAFVQDEGLGFDYQQKVKLPPSEFDAFSERGRGMSLVGALTDSLSFNETGNQIRFEKRLR